MIDDEPETRWDIFCQHVEQVVKAVGIILAVLLMVAWFAYSLWRELAIYSWLVGMG